MLLLLGAARRAKEHVRNMDSGWKTRNGFFEGLGVEVTGKTMGIVGMGHIGRAVADRARGFRMPILYHNRTRLAAEQEGDARYFASLEDMLPHCQVLSLNLPGGQGVLMTRERFALLPKGAIFVNSARGALVDEDALMDAHQRRAHLVRQLRLSFISSGTRVAMLTSKTVKKSRLCLAIAHSGLPPGKGSWACKSLL